MDNKIDKFQEERQKDLIIGRNAVTELIKSGREIDTLFVLRGEKGGSVGKIIGQCRDKDAVIKEVDKKKLDFMCGHSNHQGVVAICAAHDYSTVEEILAVAEERGEAPFIVACDGIEDPHNLGAIIRTAKCAGADAVIIPKRNATLVTSTVEKCSAGAASLIPIVKVTNLTNAIDLLKEHGFWAYAAEADGEESYTKVKYNSNTLFVLGGENQGVSKLTRQKCDMAIKINMKGEFNSLNVSNAAGILMFEFLRQQEV